jgi:hypothetical protein
MSDEALPLIVVLPGALGSKAWYSQLATKLASEGDGVVLVTEQIQCLPPGCDGCVACVTF